MGIDRSHAGTVKDIFELGLREEDMQKYWSKSLVARLRYIKEGFPNLRLIIFGYYDFVNSNDTYHATHSFQERWKCEEGKWFVLSEEWSLSSDENSGSESLSSKNGHSTDMQQLMDESVNLPFVTGPYRILWELRRGLSRVTTCKELAKIS